MKTFSEVSATRMMIDTTEVCGITVTYGERWKLLRKAVSALVASKIGHIVVVDNGAPAESELAIRQMAIELGDRMTVLRQDENLGSAGGFKLGLEHAMRRTHFDYFWLLDDDNEAGRDTLENLLHVYKKQLEKNGSHRMAVQSFRSTIFAPLLSRTRPVRQWNSTFLDFHFLFPFRQVKSALGRLQTAWTSHENAEGAGTDADKVIEIPSGVYGGLFLGRVLIEEIGYPDDRLFVYCDDTEFTARIRKVGGKLFLVPASVLTDVDSNAYMTIENAKVVLLPAMKRHFETLDASRVYYWVRNQSYFERKLFSYQAGFNPLVYLVNKFLVLLILFGYAFRLRKMSRMRLIWSAIRDGERGVLGKRSAFPGV